MKSALPDGSNIEQGKVRTQPTTKGLSLSILQCFCPEYKEAAVIQEYVEQNRRIREAAAAAQKERSA